MELARSFFAINSLRRQAARSSSLPALVPSLLGVSGARPRPAQAFGAGLRGLRRQQMRGGGARLLRQLAASRWPGSPRPRPAAPTARCSGRRHDPRGAGTIVPCRCAQLEHLFSLRWHSLRLALPFRATRLSGMRPPIRSTSTDRFRRRRLGYPPAGNRSRFSMLSWVLERPGVT